MPESWELIIINDCCFYATKFGLVQQQKKGRLFPLWSLHLIWLKLHPSSCSDQKSWIYFWLLSFFHTSHPMCQEILCFGSAFRVYLEFTSNASTLIQTTIFLLGHHHCLSSGSLQWPSDCNSIFLLPSPLPMVYSQHIRKIYPANM